MVIFNGYDFSQDFKVTSIKRSILPPSIVNTINVTNKDGVKFKRKLHDAQKITVTYTLKENNLTDLRAKVRFLASKLNSSEPQKLVLKDEPDKYLYAIVIDSTEIDEVVAIGQGSIDFFCPDSIAYGQQVTRTITDSLSFTYAGTYETKGTITVNVNATKSYLKITHLETGEFLYVEHNFVAGDVVTFDLINEDVKKNGNSILEDLYLESDFFKLIPGSNTFKFDPVQPTSIVYVERWL